MHESEYEHTIIAEGEVGICVWITTVWGQIINLRAWIVKVWENCRVFEEKLLKLLFANGIVGSKAILLVNNVVLHRETYNAYIMIYHK